MAENLDVFEEVLPKLLKIQLFSDFKADNENDMRSSHFQSW